MTSVFSAATHRILTLPPLTDATCRQSAALCWTARKQTVWQLQLRAVTMDCCFYNYFIYHPFTIPTINHIWTREQHGVSILPKDTSSCRLEEPGLEPPTARLAENLLNILSYSHQSLACCVLNASLPKNTVNTVKCSPVLNTSCTWQSMEKFSISIHLQK